MSASREKKKRQELTASGTVDPKAAKAAEEKAAARKTNILYGTLGIIFVVVAVFLVVYNSSFLTRSRTAVTIDGEKYSVAETSYYYGQAFQSFLSSDEGYMMAMYGMIDTSTALSAQTCAYDSTITWADYFKDQGVQSMCFIHAAAKAAADEGVTLEDAEMETFNANVDAMKNQAQSSGVSYSDYVKNVYGPNVTTAVYESCMKDQILASKYATQYQDSLEYTEEEIQAYYEENQNTYDVVDGGFISISATPEAKTDADGNAVDPTEEETAAALEAAKETAQEILDAYAEGESLEDLAEEHDAAYTGGEELRYSSSVTYEWLFDAERKAGDTATLENDGSTYVYAVVFNGRERIEYPNYDVRHILVTADNVEAPEDTAAEAESTEGEETEEPEVDDAQIEAKAQEILDSWDGTEDGFAELAKEYSQDGNAEDGGIYEDVYWGQMVSEFQDWCYEDGRKPGDTGIVQTSYGYHIMYFVGYSDETYWHYACENSLKNTAFNDWYDGMVESVTAEINESAMSLI